MATAQDVASFIAAQDQKNASLYSSARATPSLPQVDPAWVRDWQAYMTRYAQAKESAQNFLASQGGASLDSIPADTQMEGLRRAVKVYEAAQTTGDFSDLASRVSRASGYAQPTPQGMKLSWSQIRSKLNAAGAVPALPVIEQGGSDVAQALASFQAFNGLPSTGKLSGQTLSFLSAHGEGEASPDVWKARFAGTSFAGAGKKHHHHHRQQQQQDDMGADAGMKNVFATAPSQNAASMKTVGWTALGVMGAIWLGFELMGKSLFGAHHARR